MTHLRESVSAGESEIQGVRVKESKSKRVNESDSGSVQSYIKQTRLQAGPILTESVRVDRIII